MMLIKTVSTSLNKLLERVVKFYAFSKDDVRDVKQASPFGIDSNPLPGTIAVYATTRALGKGVVVGYINQKMLAALGETRLYSVDADGNAVTYLWLKNDGTIEIGGNTNHMVRYEELQAGWNQMLIDLNAARTALGLLPSTADISGSKIDNIKTS